jgi:hypothetical protein
MLEWWLTTIIETMYRRTVGTERRSVQRDDRYRETIGTERRSVQRDDAPKDGTERRYRETIQRRYRLGDGHHPRHMDVSDRNQNPTDRKLARRGLEEGRIGSDRMIIIRSAVRIERQWIGID